MSASLRAEEIYPRLIFRRRDGTCTPPLECQRDVTVLAQRHSLEEMLMLTGVLNAFYGDHFYLDIDGDTGRVLMVIH